MTITGVSAELTTTPPKMAKELKVRVAELFTRYAFEEVMVEIARQKPRYDIHVSPHAQERTL